MYTSISVKLTLGCLPILTLKTQLSSILYRNNHLLTVEGFKLNDFDEDFWLLPDYIYVVTFFLNLDYKGLL